MYYWCRHCLRIFSCRPMVWPNYHHLRTTIFHWESSYSKRNMLPRKGSSNRTCNRTDPDNGYFDPVREFSSVRSNGSCQRWWWMESLAWSKRYVIDPRKVKMKHDVDDIIGDVGDIIVLWHFYRRKWLRLTIKKFSFYFYFFILFIFIRKKAYQVQIRSTPGNDSWINFGDRCWWHILVTGSPQVKWVTKEVY